MQVPFFRVSISDTEAEEVVSCLKSGWLTTGPRVRQFEADFRQAVQARCAVAVNSCTAAMHLAMEALGLRPGMAVLVPTETFAATAEVVRYQGAVPILVDCEPGTLNLDLQDAERKLHRLHSGQLPVDANLQVCGITPVHVGGHMVDMDAVRDFADQHDLWVVEDAAHAFPAAYRHQPNETWRYAGQNTADVTCFSFYANKTITTGEGGMFVTENEQLADHMRCMSLHGLSLDAWDRYQTGSSWDYKIVAPGFKYNMSDLAAAIGIHQLERADEMRNERENIARFYKEQLADLDALELPPECENRLHSWHLFPIRLNLDQLNISRNEFIHALSQQGIGTSVHWRPLHLHPYYMSNFGWQAEDFPVATREWTRRVSLPIFPGMQADEIAYVAEEIQEICRTHHV